MTLDESQRLTLRHELKQFPHKPKGGQALEEGYVETGDTFFFPNIYPALPAEMRAQIARIKFIT